MLAKISFITLCCLFLASCNDTSSYDYLILHPDKLEQAYSACQTKDDPACKAIKQAAHDMAELMYYQASDPEKFGKSVILLQQQMQAMEQHNEMNSQAYREQLEKLQMMYAILAMHGPK